MIKNEVKNSNMIISGVVKLIFTTIWVSCLIGFNSIDAANAKEDDTNLRSQPGRKIEKVGDYLQIINPIIVAGVSTQEMGLGHFAKIFVENVAIIHATKIVLKASKAEFSRRPGGTRSYDGMPSGHTNSVWAAAAYMRQYSREYRGLVAPLYLSAVVTGYSRIKARKHTTAQVIAGALFAEAIVFVNKKIEPESGYQATRLDIGKSGFLAGLEIKL